MRKNSFLTIIVAMAMAITLTLSGCGSSTGGSNTPLAPDNDAGTGIIAEPVPNPVVDVPGGEIPPPPIDSGGNIISITQTADLGLTGEFEIVVNFSSLPERVRFFRGQEFPNGPWVEYPIEAVPENNLYGKITAEWPKGQSFEFSYGVILLGNVEDWVNPSNSNFFFDGHFLVFLGGDDNGDNNNEEEPQICANDQFGDLLVSGVVDLENGVYRLYLNFADNLPTQNYQKLFVMGQEFPDGPWVEYPVTDDHPCYYADIAWPEDDEAFHFSFGVVKEDGSEQWVDSSPSSFLCGDHLCINF